MIPDIPEDLVPPDSPWPVVVGIDPGSRCAGYGAIVAASDRPRFLACGVLRPGGREPVAVRLAEIAEGVEILCRRLRPSLVVVEGAFSARNVKSALRIGEARGVVLAAVARRGVAVAEIAPAAAKKAIVGHGAATKEQVAAMVATLLGRDVGAPADATDALALALAHLSRTRFPSLLHRADR